MTSIDVSSWVSSDCVDFKESLENRDSEPGGDVFRNISEPVRDKDVHSLSFNLLYSDKSLWQ